MDELELSYAPKSPDLSAVSAPVHDLTDVEDLHPQHQQYRGSVSHIQIPLTPGGEHVLRSPFGSVSHSLPGGSFSSIQRHDSSLVSQVYCQSPVDIMPARRGTSKMTDEYEEEDYIPIKGPSGRKAKAKEQVGNGSAAIVPINPADIEVKTKFPVARIKRIMQADEDVGKVAQVTPVAVCKSLPDTGIFYLFKFTPH
jgi:Dr1-associated corepressor